ncbi:MAG: sugar transferase [Bacteroidales bacterium]|nr:sugar transferase [Bacteroidales bacterium]
MKRKIIYILIDILIVFISFLFFVWLKPATKAVYIPTYIIPLLIFEAIWIFVSIVIEKYNLNKSEKLKEIIIPILISNLTIVAIVTTSIYFFKLFHYSRLIVFGTILLATITEFFLGYIFYYDKKLIRKVDFYEPVTVSPEIIEEYGVLDKETIPELLEKEQREPSVISFIKNQIIEGSGKNVFKYICDNANVGSLKTLFVSTTTTFNIEKQPNNVYNTIINIKKINDIRRINKFFEAVNNKLPDDGMFIGCAETFKQRNRRILENYPFLLGQFFIFIDFTFKRVIPKLFLTKKIYFFITHGRSRVLSKAETLGRLASCGFEILDYKELNNLIYFITKKVKEPAYDLNPSYGPLFKMRRIGKNGKIIYVYKFRTMHPYAEYLQDYILKISGYSEIGKPADDFRLTTWGKFLRKYWLDELPQLINVFKGEMRLVGIRPLSKRFIDEYPEDVLKMRLKCKPGCIPPYVALLKQDVKEYIESERIYLLEKEKNPFTTDIKYFFKAVYNIITNKIRSA